MKSKVVWGMFGLVLIFALILTGCGDSGGGGDDSGGDGGGNGGGGGSVSVTGVPLYTATFDENSNTYIIGAAYTGTGENSR